jgi:hypothetical protein
LAKEYEVYVPLTYNDGNPVQPEKVERIGERLLEEFGGVTFFPQPNEGRWRKGPRDVPRPDRHFSRHQRRRSQSASVLSHAKSRAQEGLGAGRNFDCRKGC